MKSVKSRTPASCLGMLEGSQPSHGAGAAAIDKRTLEVTKRTFRLTHVAWHQQMGCRCLLHVQSFSAPPLQRIEAAQIQEEMSSERGQKQPPMYQRYELSSILTH